MSRTPSPKLSLSSSSNKASRRPKRMMSMNGRHVMDRLDRSRSPRRRNSLTNRHFAKKSHSVWSPPNKSKTPMARKSHWDSHTHFFPKEGKLQEEKQGTTKSNLPTALEIFKDALESRTRISAEDVISKPILQKHEPLNMDSLDDVDDVKEKTRVKEYLQKISNASSHLNYRSRCAIQHSLDECKSQQRMETKLGRLEMHHPRNCKKNIERIRKLTTQKDRTSAEIECLAMFLETCCENDFLLSRFAMRSLKEKQSHMKRILTLWARHIELELSLNVLQHQHHHPKEKSTVDQYVYFLATDGVCGYDDLGFLICSLPRYSIVSNFGSHLRGLLRKDLFVKWQPRASKSPFMLRLHRSYFSASLAEMRHLSHLRTAQSWIYTLGWTCTSARIQQDSFALVTSTHHILNDEYGDDDDDNDEKKNEENEMKDDKNSMPLPCTNDIVRTIWDALRRNEHSSCWKLSLEECRSMLRERVGDHSECLVLNSSEVLWHEGHDRGTSRDCFVVLQGRIDCEISSLPGDVREHRLLRTKQKSVISGRPMSKKLRMVQKLMIACQNHTSSSSSSEDKKKKVIHKSPPQKERDMKDFVQVGSFHCGDVLDAHVVLGSADDLHAFTARAGSRGGAVVLRLSKDLVMSNSSQAQKILMARFLKNESGIAWGDSKKFRKSSSKILSKFTCRTLRRGDVVLDQQLKKKNLKLYWILHGTLCVTYENYVLCDMSRGERFGDVEMFTDQHFTKVSVSSSSATILELSRKDVEVLGSDAHEEMVRTATEKASWLKTQIERLSSKPLPRARYKQFDPSDPFASSISETIRETSKHLFNRKESTSSMGVSCDASAHSVAFLQRLSERSAIQ